MKKKKDDKQFSKAESARRFKAALLGSRNVGPAPMKDMKRGKTQRESDPMPNDPEALIAWGKRNILRS